MVKLSDKHGDPGSHQIDVDAWLKSLADLYPENAIALIKQACAISQKAHQGQARISGEPYFQHSLAVASIIANVHLDHETVIAALLHDVVEDTEMTLKDIRDEFGDSIAMLVDGVTKMLVIQNSKERDDAAKKQKKEQAQSESLRKMLLAMVEDVRVVLIKLADRTHNMRTLSVLPKYKQKRIARETLDIYAPLANRLGIWQIKWELEDLSFRYLEPVLYKRIANMLSERRVDREKYIDDFIAVLQSAFDEAGVIAKISGRPKHLYSIYRKMQSKNLDYEEIYDTRGVRVLVSSIPDCYTVLGAVHSLWSHIPGEFDDYIATPKQNNYQSIHTAVFGPEGKVVEVQIRTEQMHQDNELGVASHWRYKEGTDYDAGFERKITWLRQLLEWKDTVADADDFVTQFKSEAFEDRIYVFTPQGNVIDLPKGSTPLDFAYYIHTEVGHRCRGAKVNGNMVPLTHQLKTGARVEILTVKNGTPSLDWLNADLGYLKTSRARSRAAHWFKAQNYEANVASGRLMFDKELHRLGLSDVNHEKLSRRLRFNKIDDFFAAIGRGDIKSSQFINVIQDIKQKEQDEPVIQARPSKANRAGGISIHGIGNLLTQIANCCKPVPGDEIIGYITRGRGVTIHRTDCSHILRYVNDSPERLIEVSWGSEEGENDQLYPVEIQIKAFDRQGLLRDVAAVLSNEEVNIIAVNTFSDKKEHLAIMVLTMEISSLDRLSRVLSKINSLSNVVEVARKM